MGLLMLRAAVGIVLLGDAAVALSADAGATPSAMAAAAGSETTGPSGTPSRSNLTSEAYDTTPPLNHSLALANDVRQRTATRRQSVDSPAHSHAGLYRISLRIWTLRVLRVLRGDRKYVCLTTFGIPSGSSRASHRSTRPLGAC